LQQWRVLVAQNSSDRLIKLGDGCASVPERLLLAHAQGKVIFITGAGTNLSSGLPDFRELVLKTYATADVSLFAVLKAIAPGKSPSASKLSTLTAQQRAEVGRFIRSEWDVVLGMLERRIDGDTGQQATVRQAIRDIETLSETPELIELAATLVPTSAQPEDLDAVTRHLGRHKGIESTTWTVSTEV
jgi:hypothetical protein